MTDYDNLKEALRDKLPEEEWEHIRTSFDTVGDIAVIEIPPELEHRQKLIGDTLIELLKNINVVCKRVSEHEGEFRIRQVEVIAGEDRTDTIHVESGVRLMVDLNQTYFSPRLSEERLRMARLIENGEKVLVLFGGVAPYALVMYRNASPARVVSVELNPDAHQLAVENIKLNKAAEVVEAVNADASEWLGDCDESFDRVVMPLPHDAIDFVPSVIDVISDSAWIHVYAFADEGQFEDVAEEIRSRCENEGVSCKVEKVDKVGHHSPGTYRICVDLKVEK